MSDNNEHAIGNAKAWLANIHQMIDTLKAAEGSDDPGAYDSAREEIEQSPLSVMVRDGWRFVGRRGDEEAAEEYEILLSTGGPALRIRGKLDQHSEPDGWPDLEWQDWGTPWTGVVLQDEDGEALEAFARCFYFDEG